jgi:shikimate dehydrogenase
MVSLDGHSRVLVGLVGAGIQRSLAPVLHETEAARQGLRLHYQLIDVADPKLLPTLLEAARAMGFAGLNVTFPFKQAVMPLLDDLSEEARAIGAVNTVTCRAGRLTGHNTDGPGWAWGLRRALPDADLSRVALIGAGGAGSACADAVLRLGARELLVFDREPERAAALCARMNEIHGGKCKVGDDMKTATGLIHATPTGMEKFPGLPFPASLLRRELWVSEVVYVPLETELLKAARAAGCRTMDGGHMNVGQAVDAFRLFTGREADPRRMEATFRGLAGTPPAPG